MTTAFEPTAFFAGAFEASIQGQLAATETGQDSALFARIIPRNTIRDFKRGFYQIPATILLGRPAQILASRPQQSTYQRPNMVLTKRPAHRSASRPRQLG